MSSLAVASQPLRGRVGRWSIVYPTTTTANTYKEDIVAKLSEKQADLFRGRNWGTVVTLRRGWFAALDPGVDRH
jgi:hypothetical protein